MQNAETIFVIVYIILEFCDLNKLSTNELSLARHKINMKNLKYYTNDNNNYLPLTYVHVCKNCKYNITSQLQLFAL